MYIVDVGFTMKISDETEKFSAMRDALRKIISPEGQADIKARMSMRLAMMKLDAVTFVFISRQKVNRWLDKNFRR